jgi:sigma-E factor negative regulatory protein RseB
MGMFANNNNYSPLHTLFLAVICCLLPVALVQASTEQAQADLDNKAASQKAKQLLIDMAANARKVDYQGFFTYERGAQSQSFQVFHKVVDNIEKQRLVFLDGEAIEVVNNGHSLDCIHPGEKAVHHGHIQPLAQIAGDIGSAGLWQYYQAILLDDSRVAGRLVKRVYLKPLDSNRYSYVFAVDAEKQLMLKMQMLDETGRSLERFRFVSINFDAVRDEDLVAATSGQSHEVSHQSHQLENIAVDAVGSTWKVSWLPMGFVEEQMLSQGKALATVEEQHMFSDGLSSFSVFIEKSNVETEASSLSQQGGTVAFSHFIHRESQQYRVTVVGEIPPASAKTIAQSVVVR